MCDIFRFNTINLLIPYVKGVTMRAISVILLNKSLQIDIDDRKYNFEEKNFPAIRGKHFSVKDKNQLQNFEKPLKQKRQIRRLNVPNFCYLKKNRLTF